MTVNKILFLSNDEYKIISYSSLIDVTPKMTSNTTPSPYKIERSGAYNASYEAWLVFDGIEFGVNNRWVSDSPSSGWISLDFGIPKRIQGYSIRCIDSTDTRQAPKNWTFEGWNGSQWIVLDTRTNEISWKQNENRIYIFENDSYFTKYRINITATNGSNPSITEMKLFEKKLETIKTFKALSLKEQDFINYGMNSLSGIDLRNKFIKKSYIQSESITFGSGKIFTQQINLTKNKVNKILFQ